MRPHDDITYAASKIVAQALETEDLTHAGAVIDRLEAAGFTVLPMMRPGRTAKISEAVRTGDWSGISDWDWRAWVGAVHAGYVTKETVAVGVEATFLAAIHGVDGLENPQLSDLSWLRDLLRSVQHPGAFRALQGQNDDPEAVTVMLQSVEDAYRRLAQLSGQRPDIYDSENPQNRGEAA